ncbi:uncharacterized protein si:ch73-95l15.5 [Heptranchias perlo]|uniref:uncharacterized protein si:ch73-95l15.5 n=1 Tax=Heptranchias perlo TaxID=212740 RepID=UPI00355A4EE7
MKELCRVCASELKGNRRRWIFGSWAAVNLQVVLSHVLGQKVTRDGRDEFLCGKCAFTLEKVYRFDTVIARVQALSIEKIQRLLAEKDKLVQCLCYLHGRQQPLPRGQDIPDTVAQYNTLLQGDLLMSEYECWSESSSSSQLDCCRCQNRNCFGCNALRVSDSNYESVCKIPRRLATALAKGDLFQLSRDKSRSMPLDWLRTPERRGSSGSSSERSLYSESSQPNFRSLSVSSLGAVPGSEREGEGPVFDDSLSLPAAVQWMRGIVYRPLAALPGSKIPIRVRTATPRRQLSFSRDQESLQELRSEFSAEYLPLNLEKFLEHKYKPNELQQTVGQLREQLEAARTQITTLESKREESVASDQELSLQSKGSLGERSYDPQRQHRMVQRLACELHSKEQLLQECVQLFKQLTSGSRCVADVEADMIEKLRVRLKDRDEALERAADEKFSAIEEKEAEVQCLRLALREKDHDVSRLSQVLIHNEEMINMLNHTLKQKDTAVGQLETLCKSTKQVCGQREEKRVIALQEKDSLIAQLQAALQNSTKDVEALTDSLLSQGLTDGPDTPARLCQQLKDKERLLSQVLAEQTHRSADHERLVEELLNNVDNKDQVIKEMSDRHRETLARQVQEIHVINQQLAARDKEIGKWAKLESTAAQEQFTELAHLKALLDDKDQMILKLLEDGQEKDRVLSCLQGQLCDSTLLKVTMKQTL